jgi:hypothetical protein
MLIWRHSAREIALKNTLPVYPSKTRAPFGGAREKPFKYSFLLLLVILLVDFLLPFGDNCACRTRALCWVLVIARLGLHVC